MERADDSVVGFDGRRRLVGGCRRLLGVVPLGCHDLVEASHFEFRCILYSVVEFAAYNLGLVSWLLICLNESYGIVAAFCPLARRKACILNCK